MQAGRFLLRGDSATSQAVSAVSPFWENLSQEGHSLASSQAGRQAGTHLPGDSTTSQEANASAHNIPTEKGPSQAGHNPLNSRQVGRQLGTQLGSGLPRHSQGNSATSSGK